MFVVNTYPTRYIFGSFIICMWKPHCIAYILKCTFPIIIILFSAIRQVHNYVPTCLYLVWLSSTQHKILHPWCYPALSTPVFLLTFCPPFLLLLYLSVKCFLWLYAQSSFSVYMWWYWQGTIFRSLFSWLLYWFFQLIRSNLLHIHINAYPHQCISTSYLHQVFNNKTESTCFKQQHM